MSVQRIDRTPTPPRIVDVGSHVFRRDIQGLRAIAVLAVIAFHAGLPLPGGFVGVDIFFVISGYVITLMLKRQWDREGVVRYGSFYWRRFKRLMPALSLMVLVTLVVAVPVLPPFGAHETAALTGAGAILFLANFVIAATTGGYFDAPAEANPLLNTWSLSVEEQFYFVFPLAIGVAWYLSRRGRPALPLVVVGSMGLVSFGLAMAGAFDSGLRDGSVWFGFYSPLTRAWEFAAGALLVLLIRHRESIASASTALGWAGVALLTASFLLITGQTPFPGPWTLLPVIGTMMLISAGGDGRNPITRMLGTYPMVKVGDWSYSLYLWHWPFIVFAAILWPDRTGVGVVAALLAVIPALVSYHAVEQPLRSLRVSSRPRKILLVAAVMGPPLLVASATWFGGSQKFWSPSVSLASDAVTAWHAGMTARCGGAVPLSERPKGSCTWNGQASGRPLYLVGDSNADHFTEGVTAAGESLGRPVVVSTTNACPFVYAYVGREGIDPVTCRRFVDETVKWLETQPKGDVLISNSGSYWSSPDVAMGSTVEGLTYEEEEVRRVTESGLRGVSTEIRDMGHSVLLMQEIPKPDQSLGDPNTCSLFRLVSDSCFRPFERDSVLERTERTREAIERAATVSGADVIDLMNTMCPDDYCRSYYEGVPLYRDPAHLSVPGSRQLAGPLAEELR